MNAMEMYSKQIVGSTARDGDRDRQETLVGAPPLHSLCGAVFRSVCYRNVARVRFTNAVHS